MMNNIILAFLKTFLIGNINKESAATCLLFFQYFFVLRIMVINKINGGSLMDPSSFFPILQGMLGGAVSAGTFKGPIKTLEDWWYVNFGHTIDTRAEMLRIKKEHEIELYKTELLEEFVKIEPNDVKEPDLKILGPSLEASRYYIEEPELRKMFAKLVSGSMDISKEDIIHSSYVEVIKQLTTLDAENLVYISKNSGSPIAEIRNKFTNGKYEGNYEIMRTNLFIDNPNEQNQTKLGASLENLRRLGLANISYTEHKIEQYFYDGFKSLDEFHAAKKEVENKNSFFKDAREGTNGVSIIGDTPELFKHNIIGPEIIQGIIKLTPFGKNFCATCL